MATEQKRTVIIWTFCALVAVFLLVVVTMFWEAFREFLQAGIGRMALIYLILLFGILGLVLFILTWKSKEKKPLRTYLLIAGAAPFAAFVSVILHNLVSGMLTVLLDSPKVVDEPFFFILGIIVCPIAFIVGVVGSYIHFARNK